MTTSTRQSLYERLGGYHHVSGVVGDLYGRMLRHHQTWYHWKDRSPASKETEQGLFTDLVCRAAGGPTGHQGNGLQPAYAGLGLCRVEPRIFAGLAAETLFQCELPDQEKDELFRVLTHVKETITTAASAPSPASRFAGYAPGLSQREKEVLRLLALGKSNPEISQELHISINTVTRHVTNIFLKTDTRNRVEAAVYAVRHSIL